MYRFIYESRGSKSPSSFVYPDFQRNIAGNSASNATIGTTTYRAKKPMEEQTMSAANPPPYSVEPPPPLQPVNVKEDSHMQDTLSSGSSASSYNAVDKRGMLPCAIPQVSKTIRGAFHSPFARAYAPEFASAGISQEDFLTFIDGLNEVWVASPPFQVLGIAGMIMQQFYGVHPVQFAGIGLTVASGLASAATSFTRTRAYVKAINEDLFYPVGLRVQVLTTKKLMEKIGYPTEKLALLTLDWEQTTLDKPDNESDKMASPDVSNSNSLQNRMQEALAGYVMPLNFDVPPTEPSKNLLKRMGENQAKRLARKQQRKLEKKRRKGERKGSKEGRKIERKSAKEERKMQKEMGKLHQELEKKRVETERKLAESKAERDPKERQKIELDFDKEKAKIEREMAKVDEEYKNNIGKEAKGGNKGLDKVEKKEQKTANRVRWVVISERPIESEEDEQGDDDFDEDDEPDSPQK